jgi:N-acetylglucosamine kinase-like BadF-type ATPase
VAALCSGTLGSLYGIVVISGTGTISYGFSSTGKERRSSGWGPLLGDEGSGHSLGMDILKSITYAVDERGPPTKLQQAVLAQLQLQNPQQLIPWVYNEKDQSWKKIAELAPLATKCAAEGDQVAQNILDRAAEQLLLSITSVAKGLKMDEEEFPLVLAGGNLTHKDSRLAQLLSEKVKKALPKVKVLYPSVEIAEAAALLTINIFHLK